MVSPLSQTDTIGCRLSYINRTFAVKAGLDLVFSLAVWCLLFHKVGYSNLVLWSAAGLCMYTCGKCISFLFRKVLFGYVWLRYVLESLEPDTNPSMHLSDDSKVVFVAAQSVMRPPVISSKLRRQLNLRS